jgi:hypothetical protein
MRGAIKRGRGVGWGGEEVGRRHRPGMGLAFHALLTRAGCWSATDPKKAAHSVWAHRPRLEHQTASRARKSEPSPHSTFHWVIPPSPPRSFPLLTRSVPPCQVTFAGRAKLSCSRRPMHKTHYNERRISDVRLRTRQLHCLRKRRKNSWTRARKRNWPRCEKIYC